MRKTSVNIGMKFGRLTVVRRSQNIRGNSSWLCYCSCGKKTEALSYNLKSGHTTSCGCARVSALKKTATKHGMFGTRFYNIYRQIIRRCTEPNHKAFKNYGGKGVKNLWQSFDEFKKDMYRSYNSHVKKFGESNTTIDRISSEGNYSKENCRWATWKVQANNKAFPPKTVSIKRNSRKSDCPFCGVGTNVSHKLGCKEVERLNLGKRVRKYSTIDVVV